MARTYIGITITVATGAGQSLVGLVNAALLAQSRPNLDALGGLASELTLSLDQASIANTVYVGDDKVSTTNYGRILVVAANQPGQQQHWGPYQNSCIPLSDFYLTASASSKVDVEILAAM